MVRVSSFGSQIHWFALSLLDTGLMHLLFCQAPQAKFHQATHQVRWDQAKQVAQHSFPLRSSHLRQVPQSETTPLSSQVQSYNHCSLQNACINFICVCVCRCRSSSSTCRGIWQWYIFQIPLSLCCAGLCLPFLFYIRLLKPFSCFRGKPNCSCRISNWSPRYGNSDASQNLQPVLP